MFTSIQPYYIIGLQNKIKVETPGEQKKEDWVLLGSQLDKL